MITIEELPPIEGGTDKQKMFAESVRLSFLVFIEEHPTLHKLEPELVLQTRIDYRWWIDHVNKVQYDKIKKMVSSTKAYITRRGSIEAAKAAQSKAILDRYNYYYDSKPWGGILEKEI